jgi:hypothetical protein
MNWIDIACIVFVCVTVNHLGLVRAIEDVMDREFVIINCPKCLTFWVTMLYCYVNNATYGTMVVLAMSFLASYVAIWVELFEGFIDTIYNKIYEKIYPDTADDAVAADADESDPPGSVSEL